MAEPKKLIYDSGEQPEEVFLRVSGYLDRDRLYVGIYQTEYGYPELFSDLTVNLHHAPLNGVNEAYIDHNFSKDHLRFLQKYKLGRVLPETAVSGYCTFQKVAFDLKKLAEYDPQGTREFMECHGIQIKNASKQKPKNKSQRERPFFGTGDPGSPWDLFPHQKVCRGTGNRMAVCAWGGSLCSLRLFPLPRHDGRTVCMGSHQI